MADIVFLSHSVRTGSFRVGSHHLSTAMARAGHNVAHVSTPYSRVHRLVRPAQNSRREAAGRPTAPDTGLVDFIPTPLLPADILWTRRQLDAVLSLVGIPHPTHVFVDQPLLAPRGRIDATVIFRPTDRFPPGHHQRAARRVARAADGVAATSPGVLESVLPSNAERHNSCVLENGVEFARFAAAAGADKEYEFVYVGAIDHRLDLEALIGAAESLTDATFAVYGPIPTGLPDLPPNLQLRGPVKYEDAPIVMARGRIGMLPFRPTPLNDARSPMKLYEYVAAGLAVIAPFDLLRRGTRLSGAIGYDPNRSESFAESLRVARDQNLTVATSDVGLARDRDWATIAGQLLAFANECASKK